MKKAVLGIVLAAVALSGSAKAADLAVKGSTPYAARPYSWTFCYGGFNGGGVGEISTFATDGGSGFLGGQLGCNYQIEGFVVGLEGEADWLSTNLSSTTGTAAAPATVGVKNKWDADVAARLGLAFNQLLVYGKVGAIWMDNDYSSATGTTWLHGSATLPGALAGVGLEYAFAPQWTAKAEFNVDFLHQGGISLTCSGAGCGAFTPTLFNDSDVLIIGKLGVNYRF